MSAAEPMGAAETAPSDEPRVVVTDWNFPNLDRERAVLKGLSVRFEAHQALEESELLELLPGADAALVQFAPITERVLEALRGCRVVVRYGVGVDNIDIDAAARLGIPIAYVPDYCIDEVADHTTTLLLALLRRLPSYDRSIREQVWEPAGVGGALKPLDEVTVGLIGLGRIGSRVLGRLRTFGCRPIVHDPYLTPDWAAEHKIELVELERLLASADAISLHLPLSEATHHLIDAAKIERMKPTAVLVNTARGALIDTDALAQALNNGLVGGAALDVFEQEPLPADSPLRKAPNLLMTPHAAWYSSRSIGRLQQLAAEEVRRALLGEPLRCPFRPGKP